MSTAFEANAVIRFRLPTGESEIDWRGNVSAVTEETAISVFMQRANQSRAPQETQGAIVGRIAVKAFCVQPGRMPTYPDGSAVIAIGAVGEVEWLGSTYEFQLESATPAAFAVIDEVLGQEITGTLLQRTVWGESVGL